MKFGVGETVGPYKITEYIAQGGMATIFKAHHSSLDRDVALKVIHPALKEDFAFVTRLKREAAIIANLIHPNIVTVYDFTELDGLPYLVLQFIDGKTLKDVLAEQKLNTPQILNIVRPIADALAFAHEHNILHRDVKPSNILIDQAGHVYLTDFGLARIAQSGESTVSQDMLIGSPQYLSPEQAKSEPVDARTDVYSLGVVMYEMFTGRVPFQGNTPYATILAQINDAPPPPRSLNPRLRPAIEHVLLKTLAKNPNDRYASINDMIKALNNAVQGPRVEETPAPILLAEYRLAATDMPQSESKPQPVDQPKPNVSKQRPAWIPLAIGVGLILVLLTCFAGAGLFAWQMGNNATPTQRLAAGTPTIIAGATPLPAHTSVAQATAVPPTRAASSSVLPTLLNPTREIVVPAAPRGKIAYSVGSGDLAEQHAIWIANADGSNPQKIIDLAMYPALSPDGKQIAYYRMKDEGIYIANSDGGNPRRVVPGETCCVQWSRDGKRLVYFQGKLKFGGSIYIVNSDGTNNTKLVDGFNPALSPDGNKLAFANCETNGTTCGLSIYDMNSKASKMITRDGGGSPQWSPNGDRIVYQSGAAGGVNIFTVNADGSSVKQLTTSKTNNGQPAWSSDGNFIFWRSDQEGKAWGIFVMRADGSEKRLLINNVAPDGDRWGRESLSAGP